jgi:type II secretory ATPase GspE/PulE/Tfp pilus assembly ATPase PilB-like protein
LQNLLNLGIKIKSITSDDDKSSVEAIIKVCLKVPFQRCLEHLSRMYRIWLTQNPKHKSGFELKQIGIKIASPVRAKLSGHHNNSEYKRQLWLIELIRWEEEYRDYINQKSYNIETGRY